MFNVRDLMVNLAAHACGQATGGPPALFYCVFTGGCQVCTATCWDTGGGCGYTYGCGGTRCLHTGCGLSTQFQVAAATDPATASQQLGALKEQLKQALAEIEKEEKAVEKK